MAEASSRVLQLKGKKIISTVPEFTTKSYENVKLVKYWNKLFI